MSIFIERLKQVSQPPPPPIGFRPGRLAEERPKLQLLAAIQGDTAPDTFMAADAIIAADVKSAVEGKVWGVRLKAKDKIEAILKAGADFIILPAESAVISGDRKIGKVLEVGESITDILLRAVNELPVDAVLLAENGGDLTWHKLMVYERFAGLVTKPVLVQASAGSTAEELQMVWQTGVSGIVVEVGEGVDADILAGLHDKIDGLEFPSRKRRDKVQATLPHVAPPAEKEEDDEEDGDDDD